jgi:succinyl-diaminopimelate desuccinylase
MADFCEQFLRNTGFETTKRSPDDRAWSVVGTAGNDRGPCIMYHAHIVTVPLGQNAAWTYDPFSGKIDEARVYGLGSVDDKAPLAAMLQVAADLKEHLNELQGRLVIVCAADEEVGGHLGTKWLADNGYLPACDFVVVGEQTHNRVATAHKGVLRATLHVTGRTSHATDPWRGRNAINGMAHLILDLERHQQETLASRPHPLLGPPSINVGVIEGGVSANVVADACSIKVDRRMVPGEDPQAVISELQRIVTARQNMDPERTYGIDSFQISNWFQISGDDPFTQRFLEVSADETDTPAEPVGYLPGSDAKHLVDIAQQGMVVFGPGTYEVAHSTDEYTEIAELEVTYRILRRFVQEILTA